MRSGSFSQSLSIGQSQKATDSMSDFVCFCHFSGYYPPLPGGRSKVGPSGRGQRQPGMGTPESSMPSDAFAVARTSHWRHTAFGMDPETDQHRREQSPGGGDTTTAQPVVTSLLTRWPCRAHYKAAAPATGRAQAGRFRPPPGCARSAKRRVMGDEPGHGQALGQVCRAGRDILGRTSSLEALSAGQGTI